MKYIQFVQDKLGLLAMCLLKTTTDPYVSAYQKFIVLLLSDSSLPYRQGLGGLLLSLLKGANISLELLAQLGPMTCNTALSQMSTLDRALILDARLVLTLNPQTLSVLLTFTNNTSIIGRL